MDKDSALRMALDALEFKGNIWHMDCKKDDAITAIKEALNSPNGEAQPQEQCTYPNCDYPCMNLPDCKQPIIKSYLEKDNSQPEQEHNFCPRCGKRLGSNDWDVHTCTPPQPEQEPVQCWKCGDMDAAFHAKCDVPACGMKEGKTP